jgi:hypothetical protein
VTLGLAAVLAAATGSCSRAGDDASLASTKEAGRGWLDGDEGAGAWREEGADGGARASAAGSTSDALSAAPPAAAEAYGTTASGGAGAPVTTTPTANATAGGLRAGSTDDNERWDDYLRYRTEFLARGIPVHDLDVTERHVVRVRDRDGGPVLGARVRVFAGDARAAALDLRTYADGRALVLPRAAAIDPQASLRAVISRGNAEVEVDLPRDRSDHAVTLPIAPVAVKKVDVHFLLDATGSMGDEIDRLKAHMTAVADRIGGRDDGVDVRFGLTAYRDRGDAFVTRTFDLTGDVAAFDQALHEVQADGGGDTPEALSAGLRDAVTKPSWRGDDTVKLVFLVADAAPQLDDPEHADYAEEVRHAASAGIKIHPIASSGLDDQGEFVYRQLAQITTGRFVFLTYGADGGPGDATTHHVDKYAVLSLDGLVAQLIEEELGIAPSGQ